MSGKEQATLLQGNEYHYLIHLLRCAIHRDIPEELPEGMSFQKVYDYAMEHDVANLAFYAVEKLNRKPDDELYAMWSRRRDLALVRDMNQDFAREEIVSAFEERGIPYKELQGTVLKKLYPRPEYRTMSDIDFIVEKSRLAECGRILSNLGYQCTNYGDFEIVGKRKPLICVELHTDYFPKDSDFYGSMGKPFDTGEITEQDQLNELYLYNVLHTAKHYFCGGCGIRRILDMYFLDKDFGNKIYREPIDACLRKAELLSFAEEISLLAQQWFGECVYSDTTERMSRFVTEAGLHGTRENFIHSRLTRLQEDRPFTLGTKIKYILSKMFPGDDIMLDHYPILNRCRFLYPVLWIHRIFKMLLGGKNRSISFLDLKLVLKSKKDDR